MNILILQGPNLNLLGLLSSKTNRTLTLDKLNKSVRFHCRSKNVNLKIFQTHKEFQAVNFIQRNRIWADKLLLIPTTWAINNFTLFETIKIININTAVVIFEEPYSFNINENLSIFKGSKMKTFLGSPTKTCLQSIDYFLK
jgi:3-dehydroquinate dehydratase-2